MKRLIVTGLPCPPQVWEKWLNPPASVDQQILSLADVLHHSSASNLRDLAEVVTDRIETLSPDSILCHDFGVPLTLVSLRRLNKQGRALDAKVTVFNGAFKKVDIFRTPLPWRAQYLTQSKMLTEIELQKGAFDERLKAHLPRIRAIYRQTIKDSFTDALAEWFGIEDLLKFKSSLPIRNPVQIIASSNDPYVDIELLEQIRKDLATKRFIKVEYGHFPYSIPASQILPFIEEFELE